MASSLWRTVGRCGSAAVLFLAGTVPLRAQDEPEDVPSLATGPPIVTVNVAGVDRALEDVDYLFGSVERGDVREAIDGLLGVAGNLEGVARAKPFGVMIFLKPGLVPQPAPVLFVPVADVPSLTKTLELGPVTVKKLADDRYEIVTPRRTFYAKLAHGYAFIADGEEPLDRDFPDPAVASASLTARYDVSIDIRPENIPPAMRDLFVGLLRTNAQTEMQRRDDETDAGYALRKAQGMSNLEMVERLLTQTRGLTIGLDASKASRKAVFEMVFDAEPGSAFAEELGNVAGRPSRFAPLIDESAPLSAVWSAPLGKQNQVVFAQLCNAAEEKVAAGMAGGGLEAGDADATFDPVALATAQRLFDPLRATIEADQVDLFAQFTGDQERKFVLFGGLRVMGAASMEPALREVVDRLRSRNPVVAAAFDVQFGAAQADGVTLHRFTTREVRDEDRKIYGNAPGLYVGFGPDILWFAVGGSNAVPVLDQAISRLEGAAPTERGSTAPIQVVLNANRWIGLDPDEKGPNLAREAFAAGDDALRIDFRPTDNGGRLRVEAEEGFIRLLGLGAAKRYDDRQQRREERRGGEARPKEDRPEL